MSVIRVVLVMLIVCLSGCVGNLQQVTNYHAGQVFHECTDCPEMVVIPSGTFMMGAPLDEVGRYEEEGPVHQVTIKSFAVGKFDITRGQWKLFADSTQRAVRNGCAWSGLPSSKGADLDSAASWQAFGYPQDDSHPVVCITFGDAQDYVRWLSHLTGHHYRLLSEAEWEYAARAGTTTAYPWGNGASHEYANYGTETEFGKGFVSGRDQWLFTSPVGSFPPNAFGLYDMHGNVMQWVQDCFANSYAGLPTDGSAYEQVNTLHLTGELSSMDGASACAYRMARGGDMGDPPRMIRSAFRNWAPAPGMTLQDYGSTGLGFRVAREL